MRIDIFTIFPGIFASPLRESLLGRAVAAGVLDIRVHDIRDQTSDPHHQVDDEPFGGGPGHGDEARAGVRGRRVPRT